MPEVAPEEVEPCTDCLAEPCTDEAGKPELDGWEDGEYGRRCPECAVLNAPPGSPGLEAVAEAAKVGKPPKPKKTRRKT